MMFKWTNFLAVVILISFSSSALAANFWRTGTIKRVLTHQEFYGGCMVEISTTIGNGCPLNGWVSLDCNGFHSAGDTSAGKRAYATALVALSAGKKVSIMVSNDKKVTNYCIARRVDLIN